METRKRAVKLEMDPNANKKPRTNEEQSPRGVRFQVLNLNLKREISGTEKKIDDLTRKAAVATHRAEPSSKGAWKMDDGQTKKAPGNDRETAKQPFFSRCTKAFSSITAGGTAVRILPAKNDPKVRNFDQLFICLFWLRQYPTDLLMEAIFAINGRSLLRMDGVEGDFGA